MVVIRRNGHIREFLDILLTMVAVVGFFFTILIIIDPSIIILGRM